MLITGAIEHGNSALWPVFAAMDEKMLNQYEFVKDKEKYSLIRNATTAYLQLFTGASDRGSVKVSDERPGMGFCQGPTKGSRRFVKSQVGMDVGKRVGWAVE